VADHIIPLEQRPDLALEPTNVVPSCPSCNVRRGRNAKLKVPGPPTLREELAAIFERKETA
jgi:5-methylcytosine-specific restriction endonuclease McrA